MVVHYQPLLLCSASRYIYSIRICNFQELDKTIVYHFLLVLKCPPVNSRKQLSSVYIKSLVPQHWSTFPITVYRLQNPRVIPGAI